MQAPFKNLDGGGLCLSAFYFRRGFVFAQKAGFLDVWA